MSIIVEYKSKGEYGEKATTTKLLPCKKDEALEYLKKDKRERNIEIIEIRSIR